MNSTQTLGSALRRLVSLLFVLISWQPLAAQDWRQFPLGPIDGFYSITGGSSFAYVRSVDAGGPGALAGLQPGDYIHGAFGQTFSPSNSNHYGVTQELGFAIDRAEGGNGILPLQIIRPGVGGMTLNVNVGTTGAFGPAYPRNSTKYAAFYETAVAELHTRAMNSNGSMGYLTGFTGLCIIGHPNWNSTTGPKPYRLSVNKIRDFAISQINAWGYAPTESALVDGSAIPNPVGGPSNWDLGGLMMFLSEYYAKTADSSVVTALQRGTEMCANTVQWWKQPATGSQHSYAEVAGMSSHGGVTGDYMHLWYCGINMCGVHNLNGMGFARRVGMDMSVRPKDGHYYGFTNLNPGDPIPNSIVDALPSSITLPQYAADPVRGLTISNTSSPLNRSDPSDPFWYNPSVNQKYLMQMNFICRRSLGGDGCIGYAPEGVDNWDAGGRTPAALLALAMYRDDVGGLDAADLNRLEMLKTYITNNYMKQQIAHVYLIGGQVFQSLATPYLNDRQQRFYMDNWRFYYALSRTSTNAVRYVQGVGMADSGAYLDDSHCGLINAALPYGVANGFYSTLPGYNTNRSIANFKSPFLMWPSTTARTCTVTSASQDFAIDVCDGNGNVLAPTGYTATWSNVSGPTTATFSPNNTANTTIGLPTVSTTPYRVRLTVSRAGVPDLVEDIDITRADPTSPVPPSITAHPAPQTTVPGGSTSFNVTLAGAGPFIYQWRLNGILIGSPTPTSTLSLANVGQGAVGSYDCVITTPTGTLVSNSATLTINAPLVRTPGGLRREIWNTSYGAAVADLIGDPRYPYFPSLTNSTTSAEANGYGDSYGQKLSGWIKPPISGAYKFFLSSDDSSQLWLSTDATYANRVKIADYSGTTSYRSYSTGAQSTTINLVAGQKYYIEIIHKEAGDGDHVSVAWQMPGEAAPVNGVEPIPGVYLEYDQYQPLLTNHWKLDESSGTTCADSVGTATATLFNNPTRVTGISGNAISFNGTNQYAQATLDVSETVYAVSMWFRTTQSGGGLFSVVDGSSSHDRSIYLDGGNISSYIWSGETISSTGQNFADGQWHHVVHTFGGAIGGQKLYVDGVQVASGGKANSDFNWQTAIKIGYAAASPTAYFNGQIDDVRVYNAGLGVADAGLIYAAGINAVPQMNSNTFAISEGASIGASVGSMTATDANPGQTITYSIVGGNVGNRFAMNPSTGVITLAATLDYELSATHVLNITATDNGTPAQSVSATATINVTNVNEPPYFASNPVVGSPAAPGLAYSSSISGTDPENSGAITYAKLSGPSWLSIASNGALTGTPASGDVGINNFTVRATDSTSQFADVTLQIQVIDVAIDPVWTNAAGGSWPVAGNWLSGGIANGQAATANFSTLNLSANSTVTLDGSRTIGGLKFGDTTPSHDWTLNTGSSGTLTLSVSSGSPIINVSNQNTTINTVLAGNQGLVKTGAGTLTLGAVNTLTGTYAIRQGTLAVTRHNAITATSLTLGDASTGSNTTGFKVSPGTTTAVPLTSISTSSFGNGHFITLDSGGSLGANASALICTLNLAGNVPLTINTANTGGHSTAQDWFGNITGSGIASGSTSLVLDGTAYALRLSFGNSSNPNTFTGDVLVKGNVITQNQTYNGNTAANQNNGFRFNNVTLASLGGLNIVWGGETTGALNGPGNVYLNCQSALNNIGITFGNTNSDGNHTGQIVGGFGIAKVGTGTQILGGASSYGGATSVDGGKLVVNGSIGGSGVTIASGATLAGSGAVSCPVTLTSGATLAAGDAGIGTLTLSNNTVSLHDSGTVALRISKIDGILSSDRLNLTGGSGLAYKGTLTVTTMSGSDPLATGNSFTLFTKSSGSFSGSFTTLNLPALPGNLIWDTSRLTLDGVIQVTTPPTAQAPVFSLASGGYLGPQSVSISSGTAGASIRYTTDGSDPFSSGTAVTGTTPVSVAIPAPASITVRAYAFMAGMTDSTGATATYNTVAPDAVTWTNAAGGSWPVTGNWLNGIVADASGLTARFDTLSLSTNPLVTLDGARTVGGITFGDTGNQYSWTLAAGSGGSLTFDATGTPVVKVNNQSAFISAALSGSKGLSKTGAGTLVLTGANSYTGATGVSTGVLQIGTGTSAGSLNAASPVTIASGTSAMWWHNNSQTIGNAISGTGQWIIQGTNATDALQQSMYTLSGNNSGFSGELILNRAMAWNITAASQLGSGSIRVQDRATLGLTGGVTLANTLKIENGAGWHHNVSGDIVLGALRLEGNNTCSGNLQLNQTTGVTSGDPTGANSTFGSWGTANSAFTGVISGTGELSMSRFTSWNGGSPQTANIDLVGTASNTFTGKTVVDGQGGVASLRLMKTGGAVAIPGGNIVQLGNATSGQANLRIGDTTATGAARDQWNNQFGANNGGVVLNFANASGQWMRVDLQGTQQSVAGLNAGTLTTQAGAVIQNQNLQAFDPGQDATLTLTGSGSYLYNGYLRDQDNSGTTRKIHLVKSGSGTQTLAGGQIYYAGNTTVIGGRLIVASGAQQAMKGTSVAVASGGILELNLTSKYDLCAANTVFSGAGIIQKSGSGVLRVGYNGGSRDHTIAQSAGGMLDVQGGDLNIGWSNVAFTGNQGGLNLAAGGMLHNSQTSGMQFDGLTGAGDLNNAFNSTTPTVTIGVANTANNAAYGISNNTANFSGRIGYAETYNTVSVGTLNLVKTGSGTQILSGVCGYTGTTAVNGGTLLINGSLANTTTTVAAAGTLGGTGSIAGAVTNNGSLAPGSNGVGNFTVNNALTLAPGSAINWQVANWTGAAGSGWDKFTATSLNITATSGNPIVIRPADLALANFTEANTSFVIAQTTSGITGFSADKFTVNTAGLTVPQGTWTVQQSGNNLVLVYTRYNTTPVFTADPIIGSATEDSAISGSISANDPDLGETLTYTKDSGPAWLAIAANGALSGTPANSNVGVNTFSVRVTDSFGAEDTATLQITVANTNDAPGFISNPISGSSATEDGAYSASIAGTATDMDAGDTLTYSKVSGPAWLIVAANGALTGTPANSDVGANAFTVRATDGSGAFANATLNISVTNTNDAPTFTSNPITGSGATEDSAYSASIAGSATDVDTGDTLTYSKVSGPAWLSVASNGALSGTPTNSEVGTNAFTVRVTDGSGAFSNATLNISVTNTNDAPVFIADPTLRADGTVGSAYTGQSLAGAATDVDTGATLTYSKVSGPAWLSVASNGALTGTPPTGSTGLNSFIVRVTDNASATDDAELRINVVGLPLPWTNSDIGTGMLAGSTSHSSGTFTEAGSGALGGTTDKLQFAYQTLTGDGEIIARISSLQDTGTSSRVGVMIRDTLATNSKQIFMGLTSTGSYRWVRRTTTGGTTTTTNSSTGTVPNTWVRVTRVGSTITAYKSTNGTSWTSVGSTTVTMAANCYIGLAVSSGSNTTLNTSQFSSVIVTP